MISKDAQKILLRAAEILKYEENWVRENFGYRESDGSLKVCALGALRAAASEIMGVPETISEYSGLPHFETWVYEGCPPYVEAAEVINASKPAEYDNVPDWNDNEKTTHEDVHGVFCAAVKTFVTVEN